MNWPPGLEWSLGQDKKRDCNTLHIKLLRRIHYTIRPKAMANQLFITLHDTPSVGWTHELRSCQCLWRSTSPNYRETGSHFPWKVWGSTCATSLGIEFQLFSDRCIVDLAITKDALRDMRVWLFFDASLRIVHGKNDLYITWPAKMLYFCHFSVNITVQIVWCIFKVT